MLLSSATETSRPLNHFLEAVFVLGVLKPFPNTLENPPASAPALIKSHLSTADLTRSLLDGLDLRFLLAASTEPDPLDRCGSSCRSSA